MLSANGAKLIASRCVGFNNVDAPLKQLLAKSDIVTPHCPLTPETHHIVNATTLGAMKSSVMLVNTSRGVLVDTQAAIDALKRRFLGYLPLDVYEEEADLFYHDLTSQVLRDDVSSRLLTFSSVLITGHQAFITREAMENIASTTLGNIAAFERGKLSGNEVILEMVQG
jgi:D-lactate dehydrogenase